MSDYEARQDAYVRRTGLKVGMFVDIVEEIPVNLAGWNFGYVKPKNYKNVQVKNITNQGIYLRPWFPFTAIEKIHKE